jgi:hypothetical protein
MTSWISLTSKNEHKSKEKEKKERKGAYSKTLQIVVERKSKARDNGEREKKNVVTPHCSFLKFGRKKKSC